MGLTYVAARVRNPAQPERTWEGFFLVDTGATDCLVPGAHLRAIGMEPQSVRTYPLPDGSAACFDITTGAVEFLGELVGATLRFGTDDSTPILGLTALESAGIFFDPHTRELKRQPPSLKGARLAMAK
jgi:clan AA aspartic protease